MQDFQQRVVDEKQELDLKLNALRGFLYSTIFNGLPTAEQARLLVQEYIMTSYSNILSERIKAF